MKIRRSVLKDTVAVETYSGESAYGPMYGPSVSVRCNIDPTRRLVRAAGGSEAVSEATLYVHPDDAASFTPQSRVTISGRTSWVLTLSEQSLRGYQVLAKVAVA